MNDRILKLIAVVLFYLLMSSASAQIGIKGGIGVSNILFLKDGQTPYLGYEINSLEQNLPMISYDFGTFVTIEACKRIEIQPELLFSGQGLNFRSEYLYDHIGYKIYLTYLKVPLLLKYKISIRKKIHSALFIGPYASWKLKAVRVTEVEGLREKVIISNVKNGDFGLVTGYSLDFNLLSNIMIIDFRLCYSLINMMDRLDGYVPDYYYPSKEYARNVNISLAVGYRFTKIRSKSTELQ